MELPRPVVQAYWLGYVASTSSKPPGTALDLSAISANTPVNVVTLAFYNIFPSSMVSICFGMSQGHDWTYTQQGIAALQQAGILVTASIIGTPQPPVSWNDLDPKAFAQNAKTLLIDTLGCDGIDLDNEDSETPNEVFEQVILELRNALGPKGSPKSLLTLPSYIPGRDLPYLKKVGSALDWVSTMAYWLDASGQESLFKQYANVLGAANVLIGVSCCSGGQSTSPETVKQVAQWESQQGAGNTGGMMYWNLSGGADTTTYYDLIRNNLTIWTPPGS